jgi:Zn-dependent M28 family amino/carboxypeptidase
MASDTTEAQRWWAHVLFLADDKLEGRDTGSEGHRTAARYIAQEFERAGLQPAGKDGYLQPVRFRSYRIDEPKSSMELVFPDRTEKLTPGKEAYFGLRGNLAADVDAPMVFAGHGFAIAERGYDELAGLDLKGKIVVYLAGGPKDVPAPLLSHSQSASERWKRAKAAGAIGFASIANPKTSDIPWARARLARLLPSMQLADIAPDGPAISVTINPAEADRFFAGSGHMFADLLDLATAGKPLPKFELKPRLKAHVELLQSPVLSENVVGVKPGSHAKRKSEYIVLSAHLDHIGVSPSMVGDRIYNGAMDNASGIATLIEVARALRGKKHDRSILFLAVTGEEKGLLGSQYFAAMPTVEREALAADINFDMFLPLFPLERLIAYGVDESTMGAKVREAARKEGVTVIPDPDPARNSFIRSDQYSFIRQGIPAMSFKLGYALGSKEEQIFKGWLKQRYHSPSDDVSQPVDREAAVKFNNLMAKITVAIAIGERPRWLDTSFFKRFATTP